jgi:hypothetical protein
VESSWFILFDQDTKEAYFRSHCEVIWISLCEFDTSGTKLDGIGVSTYKTPGVEAIYGKEGISGYQIAVFGLTVFRSTLSRAVADAMRLCLL